MIEKQREMPSSLLALYSCPGIMAYTNAIQGILSVDWRYQYQHRVSISEFMCTMGNVAAREAPHPLDTTVYPRGLQIMELLTSRRPLACT